MYDGSAGIGMFLARLYRFTGDSLQKAAALGGLCRADKAAEADPGYSFGLHGGLAGLADAFINAGAALEDGALIERGLAILSRLAPMEPDPARLDVLTGSAGTSLGLARFGARFGRGNFLDAAVAHARMLLSTAVQSDAGLSWKSPAAQKNQANLVGYSHGAVGIACALANAASLTGEEAFTNAVSEALRYEHSHFNAVENNWPDLRDGAAAPGVPVNYPVAWCHGAAGAAFARLSLRELPGTHVEAEMEAAIETTVRYLSYAPPAQASFCLCHGLMGNADLLLEAASQLNRPELRQAAEQMAHRGLNTFHAHNLPWPCGVAGAGECPNLMLGLAGIGYFYLRLAAPEEVPSVLAVPRSAAATPPSSYAQELGAGAPGPH
jgi:lantibiotic modifying enzyme